MRHHPAFWQLTISLFLSLLIVGLFFALTFFYPDIFGTSPEAVLRLLMVPYIALLVLNFCVSLIVLKQAGKTRESIISLIALGITWLPIVGLVALQSNQQLWGRLRPLSVCDVSNNELKRAVCITEAARDRQDASLCEKIENMNYQEYCKKIF